MVQFSTTLLKFAKQGEKTGWTYIEIPAAIAHKLKADSKQSFRVKGKLDQMSIAGKAILPMGGGNFILPVNGDMRKVLGKKRGDRIVVNLAEDKKSIETPRWILDCLEDEPAAKSFYLTLAKSHQNYFIKWIESAKTEATKARRMAQAIRAFTRHQDYGQMIRTLKAEKDAWGNG